MPGDHPDRIKWNAKYGAGFVPSFRPNPLAVRALALVLRDGPVADLACGPSGSALLAAEQGRRVTAVDVSEVALGLLGAEARRRGLDHLITLVHADLSGLAPEPRSYALVIGIGFWDVAVFRRRPSRLWMAACWPGKLSPPRRVGGTPISLGNSASAQESPPRFCPAASPSSTRALFPAAPAAGSWPAGSVDYLRGSGPGGQRGSLGGHQPAGSLGRRRSFRRPRAMTHGR